MKRSYPDITKSVFGKTAAGEPVHEFTLDNGAGMVCRILDFGGAVRQWLVPNKSGPATDIVLGYDNVAGYENDKAFFGVLVGRVANRIGKGEFSLGGKLYTVSRNSGKHMLHGGFKGFSKVRWDAEAVAGPEGPALQLQRRSPDGEEGFPGNLDVRVVYTLTKEDELQISYEARTDRATPVNLTNHSYFNLSGHGTILEDELQLEALLYTAADNELIPMGRNLAVAATPMDFRTLKPIGKDLRFLRSQPQGYDCNYVLIAGPEKYRRVATLLSARARRKLEVWTDQAGIQLYTSNFLDGSVVGKNGETYSQYAALCLETQAFPDAVNQREFPPIILQPGEVYRTKTSYRVSREN